MIIDSSTLLAVILKEAEARRFVAAMIDAPARRISAANWLETAMRVDNHADPVAARRFGELILELAIEIVPVSVQTAAVARRAHQRFGRTGQTKAKLNFGDCFAYPLANIIGESLLFKGDDFPHTDITPALT